MEINTTEIGGEYMEVLKNIIEIRKERRINYGDSFMKSTANNLLVMAKEKILRFETSINPKEDDLIDSVNYIIFSICVMRLKK